MRDKAGTREKEMPVKPPFTEVEIPKSPRGFYEGHSIEIALASKGIMVALVLWALFFPLNANNVLSSVNWTLMEGFNTFYIIAVGLFFFFLAAPPSRRCLSPPAPSLPGCSPVHCA